MYRSETKLARILRQAANYNVDIDIPDVDNVEEFFSLVLPTKPKTLIGFYVAGVLRKSLMFDTLHVEGSPAGDK